MSASRMLPRSAGLGSVSNSKHYNIQDTVLDAVAMKGLARDAPRAAAMEGGGQDRAALPPVLRGSRPAGVARKQGFYKAAHARRPSTFLPWLI